MSAASASAAAGRPRVAIIGGGAAGLVALKVFGIGTAAAAGDGDRDGGDGTKKYDAVVLEKDDGIGGVWRHVPNSKTRPMYRGLRTNLPKEIMAFREFPWRLDARNDGGGGDSKDKDKKDASFVTHKQVLQYLNRYKNEFGLDEFIRTYVRVEQLTVLQGTQSRFKPDWPQIRLDYIYTATKDDERTSSEVFDAVCVCNGHYSLPVAPPVPGLDRYFRGVTMHSIAYDDPADFAGRSVLCIGGRASGSDLAREIAAHADRVFLSDTTVETGASRTEYNVTWVPKTVEILPDGRVRFDHDCDVSPTVDAIIFCTGYEYNFPFINEKSNLQMQLGGRRVAPLYEQLWHAECPNLAFIGLPHSVVPFPLFEIQAQACERQWRLQGEAWPGQEEMLEAARRDAESGGYGKEHGRVPEDTHYLGNAQWEYCAHMAQNAGLYDDEMKDYLATNKVSEESRKEIYQFLYCAV